MFFHTHSLLVKVFSLFLLVASNGELVQDFLDVHRSEPFGNVVRDVIHGNADEGFVAPVERDGGFRVGHFDGSGQRKSDDDGLGGAVLEDAALFRDEAADVGDGETARDTEDALFEDPSLIGCGGIGEDELVDVDGSDGGFAGTEVEADTTNVDGHFRI